MSALTLQSLEDLLQDVVTDLLGCETQLVKALPVMANGASSAWLRDAIDEHFEKTRERVTRLREIETSLGLEPVGKHCVGLDGMLDEGQEAIRSEGLTAVCDARIIVVAQRIIHYKIASYGMAKALALQVSRDDIADYFDRVVKEEKTADERLSWICTYRLFPDAQVAMMENPDGDLA